MKLLKKIGNRISYINKCLFIDLKYFPMKYTIIDLLFNTFSLNGRDYGLSFYFRVKRDKRILRYLERYDSSFIDKYLTNSSIGEKNTEKKIWVCWFQGEKNAPVLVKKCINSIRNNNPDCKVTIIDLDNYSNYVKIAPYIVEKYEKGQITHAHFSDILRINLIKTHGGIWIDSTVFCSQEIPEKIFQQPFFTCKSKKQKTINLSGYQWTGFIIGGYKNSALFSFIAELLDEYWKDNNIIIEYLLLDYAIYLAEKKIELIGKLIEDNPINNTKRDQLQARFNEPFDVDEFKKLVFSDTYLFKTSWRIPFDEITKDGEETYYGYFVNKM